jgi:hypothetical protein
MASISALSADSRLNRPNNALAVFAPTAFLIGHAMSQSAIPVHVICQLGPCETLDSHILTDRCIGPSGPLAPAIEFKTSTSGGGCLSDRSIWILERHH